MKSSEQQGRARAFLAINTYGTGHNLFHLKQIHTHRRWHRWSQCFSTFYDRAWERAIIPLTSYVRKWSRNGQTDRQTPSCFGLNVSLDSFQNWNFCRIPKEEFVKSWHIHIWVCPKMNKSHIATKELNYILTRTNFFNKHLLLRFDRMIYTRY